MSGSRVYFKNKLKGIKKKEFLFLILLLLFLGWVFWLLFDTHILQEDAAGNLLTGESTYGDLPFHLSTISQIAYGKIFPPEHPFFAGRLLVYPYFINLISASFVLLGFSLRNSIILPGIFFALITTEILYFFYKRVSKSYSVALLATFLFWFDGGLGFYYFFKDAVSKNSLKSFIVDPTKFPDYTHLFSENIQWNNFLTRIVVPERAVLLGIPIGLIILYLLFVKKRKNYKFDKSFFLAAVLTGILPIIHTHTFLVFSLVIPFLALFEFEKKEKKEWLLRWALFGLLVLVFASPYLFQILSHVGGKEGFIRFHVGWMAKTGFKNFLFFWFKNAGILIAIMIASLFIKDIQLMTKRLVYAGFLILVVVNFFLFQPFDWDNIKLLFWVGIFGALSAATFLTFAWKEWGVTGKAVAVFLFLGLTFSSYLSLYREIRLQHVLFSKEETSLAGWVKEATPIKSLFLTAPIHNSFVSNLAGRRILMGYQGILWTQGISYQERERDIKSMYQGDRKLLKKYNVSYIVVGREERRTYKPDEESMGENFPIVKETQNYKIYEVINQ